MVHSKSSDSVQFFTMSPSVYRRGGEKVNKNKVGGLEKICFNQGF